VSYAIRVTHPASKISCSLEYATREHEAETSEEAVQLFQVEAGPIRFDLCRANTRLFDGEKLEWKDRYTGKTVVAFKITHVISVTHLFSGDRDDYELKGGSVQDAAETFESEAEPGLLPKRHPDEPARTSYPLSEIVEDLAMEGRVESFNEETGKRVVAFELVEAVA
jgi:hypothetical protein